MDKSLNSLRDEYLNMQSKLLACDHKPEVSQTTASSSEPAEATFARRLLSTAKELFESEKLSDMTVILDGRKVPCHRFVFVARSDCWNVNNLAKVSTLEFEGGRLLRSNFDIRFQVQGLPYDTGHTLLKWVYTDEVDVKLGEWVILDLMHAAKRFKLHQLIQRCERLLISNLNVNNCVKFYKCAMDLNAEKLLETTSHYIVSLLNNIPRESFDQLGNSALHSLLESRFKFPLHAAISLRREDVVRLCVNEHSDRLSSRLVEPNEKGETPLQMALESRQDSIAQCLVDGGADVDAKSAQGVPLIIDFLKKGDYESCNFLTANAACLNCFDPADLRNGLHILAAGCVSSEQDRRGNMAPYADLVRRFLAGDVPINAVDKEHNTPLHLAVLGRNTVFFSSIAKLSSLNLDMLNERGLPALWYALDCPDSDFTFAEELIKRGANFNSIRPSTGDTLLSMCVKNDLVSAALYLVDKGASVDVPNIEGETALYLACSSGISDLVAVLLGRGANPNVQRKGDNETPLLVAIRKRHYSVIDVLLRDRKEGSCRLPLLFELTDKRGDNALSLAINSGLYEVADKLISAGCSVNSKSAEGELLLKKFIKEDNSDACLYLIEHGCDINEKAAGCPAPLIQAVERHLPRVVEALCKAGVDTTTTNDAGESALWIALCLEMEDVATILVKNGMDVDAWVPGPSGCLQTLLHKAIDENNQSAACFLIQNECSVNALRKESASGEGRTEAMERQTPLHMAVAWGLSDVVAALIYYGADLNAQDSEGKTPLHVAVINQHLEISERLLQSVHVDMMIRDKKGMTPFAWAVQAKANRMCDLILKRNPQVALHVDSKGYNVLHNAVVNEDYDLFCFLLSVNVDVNVRTQDGDRFSALHVACRGGNELIVRNLLLAGSRINDTNSSKQTALHVAAQFDHPGICSILLANGVDASLVDSERNNALHVAVQWGSLGSVRTLLTESAINPFAVNAKGYGLLHLLGMHSKDNASDILDVIMKLVPEYPVDMLDPDGNTLLLLAYMHGNFALCMGAIKNDACVGITNRQGVSIFNYPSPSPKLLHHLLDQLVVEPKWAEGENCTECGTKFGITTRKHHCRHCGRLLCTKCSEHFMPIVKYDLNKSVRVCDVCFDVLKQYAG